VLIDFDLLAKKSSFDAAEIAAPMNQPANYLTHLLNYASAFPKQLRGVYHFCLLADFLGLLIKDLNQD